LIIYAIGSLIMLEKIRGMIKKEKYVLKISMPRHAYF